MSARSNNPRAHVPALDGLRGLAIILVLCVHFIGDLAPHGSAERALVKVANYGTSGVDLFFVLSGFLITGILWDSKSNAHFFRNFYIRRTLRIFPLYYLVLAVLFGLLPLVPALYPAPLAAAAAHQGWLWLYGTNFYIASKEAWALSYVSHFWSLAVEEHFYLVWPWVVLVSSRRTLLRVCTSAIVFSLCLRWGMALLGAGPIALQTLTPCRLDALCAGGFLAVSARPDGLGRLARVAFPTLCASGAVIFSLSVWHATTGILDVITLPARGTFVALLFGALLTLAVTLDAKTVLSRFFASRVMRFFGKYSYGLYVFHGIVSYWLLEKQRDAQWLTARLGSHMLALWVQAIVGSAVSLLIAYLSYELFEKHLLSLKDRFAPPTNDRAAVLDMSEPQANKLGT